MIFDENKYVNMKTIVINASPRKKWNTAEVMEAALKGAESVGAETEYFNLSDLVFKGCRSCLACKLKDKTKGKCYWMFYGFVIIRVFAEYSF